MTSPLPVPGQQALATTATGRSAVTSAEPSKPWGICPSTVRLWLAPRGRWLNGVEFKVPPLLYRRTVTFVGEPLTFMTTKPSLQYASRCTLGMLAVKAGAAMAS